MRIGQRKYRLAQSSSRHPAKTDDGINGAEQFLLAEYELINSLRATMVRMVENRITFVTGLQASEIALVVVLITSKAADAVGVLILVCALGFPTLLLTYIVFLRALDMQVTGRRYLHALNAIRGYFVTRYPEIKVAVRLPAGTHHPRFGSVGSHSSILLSMAATMLIVTATLATVLTASISWLALKVFDVTTLSTLILIPVVVALFTSSVIVIGLSIKMNRFLSQAAKATTGTA